MLNLKPTLCFPCKETKNSLDQLDEHSFNCSVCSKQLIDFTKYSDVDLRKALQDSKDNNPCGIFRADQVQAALPIQKSGYFQRPIRWSILAILGIISMISPACEEEQEVKNESDQEKEREMQLFRQLKFPVYLRGKIAYEEEEESYLPVKIQLIEKGKVVAETSTTKEGYYIFEIQENTLQSPDFEMVASGFGVKIDTNKQLFKASNYFKNPFITKVDAQVLPDKSYQSSIYNYLNKEKNKSTTYCISEIGGMMVMGATMPYTPEPILFREDAFSEHAQAQFKEIIEKEYFKNKKITN